MTNETAARKSVKAMETAGLLEDVDAAIVEAVIGLARATDDEPSNASLWGQYLKAMGDLRSLSDGGTDAFESAMERLYASVRNTQDADKAEPSS